MGGGPIIPIKTPEELSEKLCYEYISKFARATETGEVYDIIRKWHLEKWT